MPSPTEQVPAELVGRAWVSTTSDGRETVGRLGSPGYLEVAAGQHVVATTGTVVVTTEIHRDGTGSELRRIDLEADHAGTPLAKSASNLDVGVIVDGVLFVSGHDPSMLKDPGVQSMSLSDNELMTVVGEGATLPSPVTRTLIASPSGRTAVSALCEDANHCRVDVIDTESRRPTRVIQVDGVPSEMTDYALIVRVGQTAIEGVDIASGEVLWTDEGDEYQHAFVTDPGDLIVAAVHRENAFPFRILRVDSKTGASTMLFERPNEEDWTLWPALSTDRAAAIGHGGNFLDATQGKSQIEASTVDLHDGALAVGSIRFDVHSDDVP